MTQSQMVTPFSWNHSHHHPQKKDDGNQRDKHDKNDYCGDKNTHPKPGFSIFSAYGFLRLSFFEKIDDGIKECTDHEHCYPKKKNEAFHT